MRFLLILIIFILAVGGFTVLAKLVYQDNIESELTARSMAVLKEAGYEGVVVTFDHTNARVSGLVDDESDKEAVLRILQDKVEGAYFPTVDATQLGIRPTVAPEITILRELGSREVKVTGAIAAEESSSRVLIGSRLHHLESVDVVDNAIQLDPKRLPLPEPAVIASIAAGLIEQEGEVRVVLSEGELLIQGTLPNQGLKSSLVTLAGQLESIRLRDEIQVEIPVNLRLPSRLSMTRTRFGVTLTGVISREEDLRALTEAVTATGASLRPTTSLTVNAEHAPGGWEARIARMIPVVLKQLTGETTLEVASQRVRLSGEADTDEARAVVAEHLKEWQQAEPDLSLVFDVRVAAPVREHETPRIKAVIEGGLLTLEGRVSADAFATSLDKQLELSGSTVLVKNSLEVVADMPAADWLDRMGDFFLEVAKRVEKGDIEIQGTKLTLQGQSKEVNDGQLLRNVAVNTLPPGFQIEVNLSQQSFPALALLPEVRARIEESLSGAFVYFNKNSSQLGTAEKEKLATVVAKLKETEAAPDLIIIGISDNVGNAESNRALSLKRAEEVQAELVKLGVQPERLSLDTAVEDVAGQPESVRAKSRRVELVLASEQESTEAQP